MGQVAGCGGQVEGCGGQVEGCGAGRGLWRRQRGVGQQLSDPKPLTEEQQGALGSLPPQTPLSV